MLFFYLILTVPTGLEPAISCVTGRHVNHYTTGPNFKATTPLYNESPAGQGGTRTPDRHGVNVLL